MVDRRTFLFGLPLLGLLKPRAPRPVLSVARLPEEIEITVWPGRDDRSVTWYPADHGRSIGLRQTGTWIVEEGRYLVNPDA